MFEAPAIRYVVAGRIVAVEGVPEMLLDADHEFEVALAELDGSGIAAASIEGRPAATVVVADVEVEARFLVRNVLKPPGRCPHPPRPEHAARCERGERLPAELTLRIPSDWFLWPAAGTSRRVARRAGGHLAALEELGRGHAAGQIDAAAYAEKRKELESRIRHNLEFVTLPLHGRPCDIRAELTPPSEAYLDRRLLEDRRGHIKVGGEYLLALGAGEEGAAQTHYRPSKLESRSHYDYHVFWGDEAREVETAMMLVGNCVLRKPPWMHPDHLAYACHNYARGLATFWLYPEFKCRH